MGFVLLQLLGRKGWIGQWFYQWDIRFIFDFKGLVIASFIAGLPLLVKPLQSTIESFPKESVETSLSRGKKF